MRYSLLDLAPVPEGASVGQALANSLDLARQAEAMGYHRFWLAEHHGMTGIASAATAVVIGQAAAATRRIRVGAGGIMLPNHAPLVIAEQFGTLAALFPGRIDLGLGRAPGTDMATARALRRGAAAGDSFPQDVVELMGYLGDPPAQAPIRAVPGEGSRVPLWILGSSTYGAELAAHLGLPFAFASHFAPQMLEPALQIYRSRFRASAQQETPYFMLAVGLFAAATSDEAAFLRSSQQLAFALLRSGTPGPLPRPVADLEAVIGAPLLAGVNAALAVSATGSPGAVRRALADLVERYRPDEVILTGQIHDHAARVASFRIGAEAMRDMGALAA